MTPWTIAHQAPLSMKFPRQEYWSELSFPSPGDLPDPEIKHAFLYWQVESLPVSHQGRKSLERALGCLYILDLSFPQVFINATLYSVLLRSLRPAYLQHLSIFTFPYRWLTLSMRVVGEAFPYPYIKIYIRYIYIHRKNKIIYTCIFFCSGVLFQSANLAFLSMEEIFSSLLSLTLFFVLFVSLLLQSHHNLEISHQCLHCRSIILPLNTLIFLSFFIP